MDEASIREDRLFPNWDPEFYGDDLLITVSNNLFSVTSADKSYAEDFSYDICIQPRSEAGAPCHEYSCDGRTTVTVSNNTGGSISGHKALKAYELQSKPHAHIGVRIKAPCCSTG